MTQRVWTVQHEAVSVFTILTMTQRVWTVKHEAVSGFTIPTMTCGAMLLGQVHNVLSHCQQSKWRPQVDRQQKQTHHGLFSPLPSIILPDWLWVYHSTSNFNPSLPDLTHTESLAVWVSVWDDPAFPSRGNVKMSMSITVSVRACFFVFYTFYFLNFQNKQCASQDQSLWNFQEHIST